MKVFQKTFILHAEIEDVYAALTNPVTIKLWSGYPATMNTEVGTEFSLWEGDITGKNLEIISNKKIVQEWYFGDQTEKSIVTIKIFENKKGTQVEVIHNNIPDEDYENIVEGWNESYIGAIIDFFEVE